MIGQQLKSKREIYLDQTIPVGTVFEIEGEELLGIWRLHCIEDTLFYINPVYFEKKNLFTFFDPLEKLCECGSYKCGSPRHSKWCPMWSEDGE